MNTLKDPPIVKKVRESNIELFRIFLMLMIISHHYVVNSGLTNLYDLQDVTGNMVFLELFGWGGKTGINCFLLITGYFMCCSCFTWKKWWKVVLELKFYVLLIYAIFLITGYEQLELRMCYKKIFSIAMEFGRGFGGTYVCLFLLVPYLNKTISTLSKQEFEKMLLVLIAIQTIVSTFIINNYFEYLCWYITIYFIGAYIRLYPANWMHNKKIVKGLMMIAFILVVSSILALVLVSVYKGKMYNTYYFISNSNKILALISSVSFFLFFLNIKMKPNRIINTVASATFGILLIHTSGDTMRRFLWNDLFQNVSWYNSPYLFLHAFVAVLSVYLICAIIDLIRIKYIERPFFSYVDKIEERRIKK